MISNGWLTTLSSYARKTGAALALALAVASIPWAAPSAPIRAASVDVQSTSAPLGVVVTAVAQSMIGGIGLRIAGLPFAALLTALMFVLCLIQLGPGLILFPAVIWMYYSGDTFWATVLLAFSLVAATVDQFIRPILIRRGADLPLLLILAGVIGGLIAFGILGIFIGPTVLAVAYTLVNAWMEEAR